MPYGEDYPKYSPGGGHSSIRDSVKRIKAQVAAKKKQYPIWRPRKNLINETVPPEWYVARNGYSTKYRPGKESDVVARVTGEKKLPTGAVGWKPGGDPYYGGMTTWQEFQKKWAATWNDPIPDSRKPTALSYLSKYAGLLLEGAGAWLTTYTGEYPEQAIEVVNALGRAGAEMRGAPTTPEEREKAEIEAGEPPSPTMGRWGTYLGKLIAPFEYTGGGAFSDALNYLKSPVSWEEKKKVITDGWNAGRVLYTSFWVDSAKQKFEERYQDGENPFLLQLELEHPWAELPAQILYDPLNLAGGLVGKVFRAGRMKAAAAKFMVVPHFMDEFVSGAAKALDPNQFVQKIVDVLPELSKYADDVGKGAEELANSYHIAQLTAGGKRWYAAQESMAVFNHIIASTGNNADDIMEYTRALINITSKNADEKAEAVAILMRFPGSPRPFFSEPGVRTSIFMRRLLENADGAIDAQKFLDELTEISQKGLGEASTYLGKKLTSALEGFFPTALDNPAVHPVLRGMAKIHERLYNKGPWKFFNNIFATVYMGLNPGFAFRNLWSNLFHVAVDEGPGGVRSVFRADKEWKKATTWMGMEPRGAYGYSFARGEDLSGWIQSRAFLKLSEIFEETTAKGIVAKAINTEMPKLMSVGLDQVEHILTDAGLTPVGAKAIKEQIIAGFGDTVTSKTKLLEDVNKGIFRVYKAGLSSLTPADRKLMREYGLSDEFIEAVTNAETYDEAAEIIGSSFDDLLKVGDTIVDDIPVISKDAEAIEVVHNLSVAADKGDVPQEVTELAQDYFQANHVANVAGEELYRSAYQEATAHLQQNGVPATEIRPFIDGALDDLVTEFNGKTYKGSRILIELEPDAREAARVLGADTVVYANAIDIAAGKADLEKIWKEIGLEGQFRADRRYMKNELWVKYWRTTKNFWQEHREVFSKAVDDAVATLQKATGFTNENVGIVAAKKNRMVDLARRFDKHMPSREVWVDLQRAIRKGDNEAIAIQYWRAYGLGPSATAKGVPLKTKMLRVINKTTKGNYKNLAEVPPEVSRDALKRYSLGFKPVTEAVETLEDILPQAVAREAGEVAEEIPWSQIRTFADDVAQIKKSGWLGAKEDVVERVDEVLGKHATRDEIDELNSLANEITELASAGTKGKAYYAAKSELEKRVDEILADVQKRLPTEAKEVTAVAREAVAGEPTIGQVFRIREHDYTIQGISDEFVDLVTDEGNTVRYPKKQILRWQSGAPKEFTVVAREAGATAPAGFRLGYSGGHVLEEGAPIGKWSKTGTGRDVFKTTEDRGYIIFPEDNGKLYVIRVDGTNLKEERIGRFDTVEEARRFVENLEEVKKPVYHLKTAGGEIVESYTSPETAKTYLRGKGYIPVPGRKASEIKSAIDDIFTDLHSGKVSEDFAYRGIDRGEYEDIIAKGRIKSTGEMNLSNEPNMTLFGEQPVTAHSYAGGFAVKGHLATRERPSYVLEVVRTPGMRLQKRTNYIETAEDIPFENIKRVIEMVPDVTPVNIAALRKAAKAGKIEDIIDAAKKIDREDLADVITTQAKKVDDLKAKVKAKEASSLELKSTKARLVEYLNYMVDKIDELGGIPGESKSGYLYRDVTEEFISARKALEAPPGISFVKEKGKAGVWTTAEEELRETVGAFKTKQEAQLAAEKYLRAKLGLPETKSIRAGITNVFGREGDQGLIEQTVNEIAGEASEAYGRGESARAIDLWNSAIWPARAYLDELTKKFNGSNNFTFGRFLWGTEPSVYHVAQVADADLPEYLYTLSKVGDTQFKQNAVYFFDKELSDVADLPLGDYTMPNGLRYRVEQSVDIVFNNPQDWGEGDFVKNLDKIIQDAGLPGYTIKPDRSGIEIVWGSWYNDAKVTKDEVAQKFKQAVSGLHELGNVRGYQLGTRRSWLVTSSDAAKEIADNGHNLSTGGYTYDDLYSYVESLAPNRAQEVNEKLTSFFYRPQVGWKTAEEKQKFIPPTLAKIRGQYQAAEAAREAATRIFRGAPPDQFDEIIANYAKTLPSKQADELLALQKGEAMDYYKAIEKSTRRSMEDAERLLGKKPIETVPTPTGMPSAGQVINQQREGITALRDRVLQDLKANWGRVESIKPNPKLLKGIDDYFTEAERIKSEARVMANAAGVANRDFILHAYPGKRNFDLALSYLMPWHFWYTRTYAKWMERIVSNPEVIAAYAYYRDALSQAHAGAPEWWKYQINTNELLGLDSENPFYFNLEATLNPMNALIAADFNDQRKRVNWFTSMVDDLGKFGPSLWAPIQFATAAALYKMGEKDAAARWGNRLFPQTRTLRGVTALLGVPGGLEIDPATTLFANGLDPYDERRVARAIGGMVDLGEITQAEAEEAAMLQGDNPIWLQGVDTAMRGRAWGDISSFLFGAGFRIRNQSDLEIDEMDEMISRFYQTEANLSPDEVTQYFNYLRQKYPFYNTIILSRKTEEERDRLYGYSVLSRIPPGQKDDLLEAVGISNDLMSKFYDEKGHVWDWDKTEKDKFMAGILELGALLEVPDNATQNEYSSAASARKKIYTQMEAQFGKDIRQQIDTAYAIRRDSLDGYYEYLDNNPDVKEALEWEDQAIISDPLVQKYYGSISNVQSFLKSVMFDQIESEVGKDIWDLWDEYGEIKLTKGQKAASAFFRAHKELGRYMDLRDYYDAQIGKKLVAISEKLPESPHPYYRERAEYTTGQQAAMEAEKKRELPRAYTMTWKDWQGVLSEPLQGIVLDYLAGGEELPEAAIEALDKAGQPFNADSNLLLALLERALGQYLQAE